MLQQDELPGINEEGDNPLHSIAKQTDRPEKDKVEMLVTLLTLTAVDINSRGKNGMTALHYAVQVRAEQVFSRPQCVLN